MNLQGRYNKVLLYNESCQIQLTSNFFVTFATFDFKALPVSDGLFTGTVIRSTGSVAHDMHVFTVKAPGEQRYAWDYLRPERMIPAAEAFGPAQAACVR